MEFGYWAIKAHGEVIRMLAAYFKIPLTEYNPADDSTWAQEKSNFGAPFPNLPYIVHDDFKLTESRAIIRYMSTISNRSDMLSDGCRFICQVIQIYSVMSDIEKSVFSIMRLQTGFEDAYTRVLAEGGSVRGKIAEISEFLGDKDFLVGGLTIADFEVVYKARYIQSVAEALGFDSPFHSLANLANLIARVENLLDVKELIEKRRGCVFSDTGFFPVLLKKTV